MKNYSFVLDAMIDFDEAGTEEMEIAIVRRITARLDAADALAKRAQTLIVGATEYRDVFMVISLESYDALITALREYQKVSDETKS